MRGVDFYPATDFVSALVFSAQIFKNTHGFVPMLAAPSSFNEHIFVRKFFAALPMPSLADKLEARAYVQARLGDAILPSVVWVGDAIDALFEGALPSGRFVLKSSLGSGTNQILNLPADLVTRRGEIEKRAAEWLASRFGYAWGEWQYCTAKPRLFLEVFFDFNPGTAPDGFKIFCFKGKARMIQVHLDRYTRHRCANYDVTWKHLPVAYRGYEIAQRRRPDNLDALIEVAEKIAADLEFARIDLYTDGKRIIKFGEITLTPGNANAAYSDFKFDRWLGTFFAPAAVAAPR
ncbi:MAG TPA: ATP-grasp fold amidoligase family protein [Stellaceae bacterium]|nr:ATP-grasp fold amidoligase family protein [Stellaceae bacterium]